jgi:hypothetical protein
MRRVWLAVASGLVLSGLALMCAALVATAPPALGSYEPDPPVPNSPPTNTPGATPGSDGVWVVGRELKPGVYTAVAVQDLCVWVRLSGFSLSMDDVIALGEAHKGDRLKVTIKRSDRGFETHGCGTWKRVLR